nr:immunoglobulin-like domain-containing protein [uncultured Cellulosilyticum sp.]
MKKLVLIVCILLIVCIFTYHEHAETNRRNYNEMLNKSSRSPTPTDTINPTQPIHPQKSCEDSTLIIGELIKVSNQSITIEYTNKADKPFHYDSVYTLEKLIETTWEVIPLSPNYGWKDIAYEVNANKSFTQTFNLTISHGKLKSGYYRINKELYNNTDKTIVPVEFTLA